MSNTSETSSEPVSSEVDAYELVDRFNFATDHLDELDLLDLPSEPTDEELLKFPLDKLELDSSFLDFPGRHSQTRKKLVEEIASFVYPHVKDPVSAVSRYEKGRVRISRAIRLARRRDLLIKTQQAQQRDVRYQIQRQGPSTRMLSSISLLGPRAEPMPVKFATFESLQPFFDHLQRNGTHDSTTRAVGVSAEEILEPYYGTPALEFERGVVYADQRMDLCKTVVGPYNIRALMEDLTMNSWIKHFLLGNNLIGPAGTLEIAEFIKQFPFRIDTWYLAGNAIHGLAFSKLVDALNASPAASNIWLKRNPLGAAQSEKEFDWAGEGTFVDDLFKLITGTRNLRTLDLSQTNLGDKGAKLLFDRLTAHDRFLRLENLYLDGNGIGMLGAAAIGSYLASRYCHIESLYLSNNPLGHHGVATLAGCLRRNTTLQRLVLQSVGMVDDSAVQLCDSLLHHQALRVLDVGTSYATKDLGQAYNYLTDRSLSAFVPFIEHNQLQYLDLGYVSTSTWWINCMLCTASKPDRLLWFGIDQISDPDPEHEDECARLRVILRDILGHNVELTYKRAMSYDEWLAEEKRWMLSEKTDVRKIDSVYRTRDMGRARRGEIKLDKFWTSENEDVLAEAMGAMGV